MTPLRVRGEKIECFWIIRSASPRGIIRSSRIPADFRATLLLNLEGKPRFVTEEGRMFQVGLTANLLGVHSRSILLEHEGNTHMNKDFQAFTGSKPTDFRKATDGIIEVAYGNV